MATMKLLNNLISLYERTLNISGGYHNFGPGSNRGRFQHHGRGDNTGHRHMSDS